MQRTNYAVSFIGPSLMKDVGTFSMFDQTGTPQKWAKSGNSSKTGCGCKPNSEFTQIFLYITVKTLYQKKPNFVLLRPWPSIRIWS